VAREQRKLAAILAADVVGYSRLMGCDQTVGLQGRSGHVSIKLISKVAGKLDWKAQGPGSPIVHAFQKEVPRHLTWS
jgi:hypothetical protein